MKNYIVSFLLISGISLTVVIGASSCGTSTTTGENATYEADSTAIQKSFKGYSTDILNDRGESAISHLDSRTLKYYDDILESIKHKDSITISSASILDKIMILMVRQKCTKEQINSFDGKKLLLYAINSGMVGKNSVMNNSIGRIKIDKDFAKGEMLVDGKSSNMYMHFYKEEGQWKIDLTSLYPMVEPAMQQAIKRSGQTENQFLVNIIQMTAGEELKEGIWKPLE